MKVKILKDRKKYIETEIKRSSRKFNYCKVSYEDVINFRKVLELNNINSLEGPILCLGTRNGREIDLFRNVFFKHSLLNSFIKLFEIKRNGCTSLFPVIESFGRSDFNKLSASSVIGIEINPEARRPDTLIGSFDEMPEEWESRYRIIYSNSFDQSQDPIKTANEWKRIAAPGAIAFLGFTYTPVTDTDPVGELELEDFQKLFGGKIIYYSNLHGFYKNVAIQLD